uniref:BOS complex subunit TMEM147 n=1 Tax=Oryza nivara TaxID=4536 RepID=A0A0E0GU85_ORYNI
MAAYTSKIFALFALIALSASATTAITTMQYFPPTLAMGTMDPCRQYMMQKLGMGSSTAMFMSQPMALLQQQCCMQLQGMMPQCHCGTSCQMMQSMQQVICAGLGQQQMMKMAMQMPYMCNMAPTCKYWVFGFLSHVPLESHAVHVGVPPWTQPTPCSHVDLKFPVPPEHCTSGIMDNKWRRSEYDTIGTCVKAAAVYLGTALVKLVCLATLLKVPENDSFDPYQELMKIFIGFIDVAGLYFALTQLTHRNISQNHKFQAVGLGWAFADSVLHRLAPLWIGARGLEFTWEYIFQGLEANANLLLEEIIRVADSKGGWLRAVLLTGHGFHQLAAVLSLSETNVRNEFANCRRFTLLRWLLLYFHRIRMRLFSLDTIFSGGSIIELII